jgi:hypothetical protein
LLRWPIAGIAGEWDYDRWLSYYRTWERTELLEISAEEESQVLPCSAAAGEGYSVAYSPDGRILVSTHDDGLRVWNARLPKESVHIPGNVTRSVQFTCDGSGFITTGDREILWWPVQMEESTNDIIIGPAEPIKRQANRPVPTGMAWGSLWGVPQ